MSNLGQIVRLLVFSMLWSCSMPSVAQAQDFEVVTQVSEDTLWLKWLPLNYEALTRLSEGGTISRIEVESNSNLEQLNYSNGKKWTVAPVQMRYDRLDRSNTNQDRLATFLEPVMKGVSEEEQNYVFGALIVENVTNPAYQFELGNVLLDTGFNKKRKYAYRIEVANSDPLFVFVDPKEITSYSKPNLKLQLDQRKTVVCSWNVGVSRKEAFAFDIEHGVGSANNGSPFLDDPFLPYTSEFETNKDIATVRHDTPEKGQLHWYRVVGRNAFGMPALFSDWQKIYVPNTIDAYPTIDSVTVSENLRIVHAHVSNRENNNVDALTLFQSKEKDGGYEAIQTINPSEDASVIAFEVNVGVSSGDAFYYRLTVSNADDTVKSQPYYFFTLDQDPPDAPQGLQVAIDSMGIATLTWNELDDSGVLGYRVFRANAKQEEFMEQTQNLVTKTFWNDTLPLDNLTPEIYYFIEAVDANFNQGAHSDTILGLKPDTIPPVASLIRTVSQEDMFIFLEVNMSRSADAVSTSLFRNDQFIAIVEGDYVDSNLVPGTFYSYQLITTDRSGNASSSRIISQKYEPGFREAPEGSIRADFQQNVVEITYKLPELEIYAVHIYRAKSGETLRRWKTITLPADNGQVDRVEQDKTVRIGERYEYQVKYITKEGIHSLPLVLEVAF